MNNGLNFGRDPVMDPDTDSYPDRDTGKRALAEVCTVPVLLVSFNFSFTKRNAISVVLVLILNAKIALH